MHIPTKPHSQVGMIGSAVDSDYLNVNLKSFDPYAVIISGGTRTMWDLILYLSQVNGVDIKDEKEITVAEVAAAKIYPAILMSYLQALRAQKNIVDKVPIFVANIAASDGIFKEDEWWFEMNMGGSNKYPSIQGIEDFITRINPIWKITNAYPMLNFPPSFYLQWVPNKTTAEMRALRVLMGTYSEAYQTFCNKAKIRIKALDVQNFVNREVVTFKPYDYQNKDWQFWNASGGYIDIQNGANTASNYMTARRKAAGEIFDVTVANFLSARDKYYVIPEDGEPSDLNAVIQMFYPHTAENLMGCAVPDDGGGINLNTLRAADVYAAQLARNAPADTSDTVPLAVDREQIRKLFTAFPLMFGSQDGVTSTLIKLTEEAGEATEPHDHMMTGGLRILNYDTNVWDNTNGLLLQTFFQEMFGKTSKTVVQTTPRYHRKKKVVKGE
jgi:hypothetical protein